MQKATAHKLADDDVVIARIAKARGIRGEVACDLETDFPERFQDLEDKDVTVVMPNGSRLVLKLEHHWFHKDRVILKFSGTDTMTDAERLVGGRLVISQDDTIDLEADEFYEYELIGLEVITVDGKRIGQVKELLQTNATQLLVVESEEKRDILIPFVEDICTEVDVERGQILINPPEGLLEL
ncbi:MAG: ribosome maturation factor RimM [Acidobacteriota bacterium]